MATPIKLFLSDVDGTLVTPHKILTDRAIAAVQQLKKAGIMFAVTSGRPPRGMSMLVEPLELTTPIAAFNGGIFVNPDMTVIEQRTVPDDVTPRVIAEFLARNIDVWVYRGADWYVRDPKAPHVDIEAETVRFEPTTIADFSTVADGVAKIVGVSDDHDGLQAGGGCRAPAARRPGVGGAVAAVLRRRDPSGRQQRCGGQVPVGQVRHRRK